MNSKVANNEHACVLLSSFQGDLLNLKFFEKRQTLTNLELFNRFLVGVERRAFRIAKIAVGNTEDALDLVQEAMLKLAEKYSRKPPEQWAPLFYRILQRRIQDCYRRRKTHNHWLVQIPGRWFGQSSDEDAQADFIQSAPDVAVRRQDQVLDCGSFGLALEKALQQLPRRQQQVFLLRAWEGLDVKETAQAMCCSEGSVKTHYFRALQRLRIALGEFSEVIEEV